MQHVDVIDSSPGQYFGLDKAPRLALKPLRSAVFSMTHLRRNAEEGETFIVDLPAEPGYFLMLYLQDAYHCDVAADGTHAPLVHYRSGSICLVDLMEGASICLHGRLDALAFTLPRALFEELSDIVPDAAPQNLQCRRGELDAVMRELGVALLPLLNQSELHVPPSLRHIAIAICAHLLHTYSGVSRRDNSRKTTLSLKEEAAAKTFMVDHLSHDVRVAAIAAAVGVSTGHFSQGFRQATGYTPHQWLIHARIERAKDLLVQRDIGLATIAKSCGFTDQSHFTKVFQRETGLTPAVWRSRGLQ